MAPNKQWHPLHPAVVHFPIAFFITAHVLHLSHYALVHPRTGPIIAEASSLLPPDIFLLFAFDATPANLSRLAHTLLGLGVLTALPAVFSGVVELIGLFERQAYVDHLIQKGVVKNTQYQSPPRVPTAVVHAAMMDAAVISAGFNWWNLRKSAIEGAAPGDANVMVSLVGILLLSVGGFLGSRLVYRYGVRVNTGAVRIQKKEE